MTRDFREFWMDWDSERSAAWLRERYLSFRLHHAELQTYASPEEFADLFVEWCRPKEDPYLCVTCRTASDDCSSDDDNCCSGCRHTASVTPAPAERRTEPDEAERAPEEQLLWDIFAKPPEHQLLGTVCSCGEWSAGCGHDVTGKWADHLRSAQTAKPDEAVSADD